MKCNIYEYLDYRKFIQDLIKIRPDNGRGERKKIADVLNCQMAFITHVLSGEKDFNHEQILKIAQHFHLNQSEKEYLLDLLSFNRAGTKDLKIFYEQRLKEKAHHYNLLQNRFEETQSLSLEDQTQYYSHWLYGAIHMASTVPHLQSVQAIARHFNIAEQEVQPLVEFLARLGLLELQSGQIKPGKAHLYVSADSPLANQHHAIWRIKALHDLESNKPEDFHYSLCFSVSQKDWPLLREKMVTAIGEALQIIRPSKEEKLGLLCVDFQEV